MGMREGKGIRVGREEKGREREKTGEEGKGKKIILKR